MLLVTGDLFDTQQEYILHCQTAVGSQYDFITIKQEPPSF